MLELGIVFLGLLCIGLLGEVARLRLYLREVQGERDEAMKGWKQAEELGFAALRHAEVVEGYWGARVGEPVRRAGVEVVWRN